MRPLSESYETLRVRVESRAELPVIVLVTAAQRGDGTTSVACGLARAFAEDGHRTLLVDANWAHPAVAAELEVNPLPILATGEARLGARNGEVPRLSLLAVAAECVREPGLNSFLSQAREGYAVTIVDAGPLPTCSTALYFARRADAIVLTVRLGRRSSESDREAAQMAGERLVGVVPTRARGLRKTQERPLLPTVSSSLLTTVSTTGVPTTGSVS